MHAQKRVWIGPGSACVLSDRDEDVRKKESIIDNYRTHAFSQLDRKTHDKRYANVNIGNA